MKAFPHKVIKTVSHHSVGTGIVSSGTKQIEINDPGMDLRDYFAAKAMQAIIINSKERDICVDEIDGWIGHYAYTVADAMMKER